MKKQTAHKAHAAAIMTVFSLMLAQWGLGEAPSVEELTRALTDVGAALAGGLASWLVTYFKANHDKETPK